MYLHFSVGKITVLHISQFGSKKPQSLNVFGFFFPNGEF